MLQLRKWALMAVRSLIRPVALTYRVLPRSRRRHGSGQLRKRILVINGGHIGDTLLATSIIPVLRSAFPHAQLGFAGGSWSRKLLQNNPDLTFNHVIDHWRLNRTDESWIQKARRYIGTRRSALRAIRELKYDICLCPFPLYPDMLFFAQQAGIPVRIGFSNSVFSPFATALAEMPESPFVQQARVYAEILRPLAISEEHMRKRRVVLPDSDADAEREVRELLQAPCLQDSSYVIVHMGSGNRYKELTPEFWRIVAADLSMSNIVLFTGAGDRENQAITETIRGLDNCVNGCGKLSWNGFVAAVRGCRTLYGVDTMAGHVAAAVGKRCILVYSGIASVSRWRPETDNCIVLTNHVPCAPCSRPHGCSDMRCLKGVSPEDVLNADAAAQGGVL